MASGEKTENKNRTGSPLSAGDYEKLGRQLEGLVVGFDPSRRRIFTYNFLIGLVKGFGGVLGATIGIAILIWLLSLFSNIPLVGPFVNNVKHSVNTSNSSR